MTSSAFNSKVQLNSKESKIVVALERISEAFKVLLWKEAREFKLSPLQVQVLTFVAFHRKEWCSVGYLAKEFNVSKPTISDAVKVLLEKGLLSKESHAEDGRRFALVLTKTGQEVASKASMFAEELDGPLEGLSDSDLQSLLYSLLEIIKHLNKAGVITVQRMCFSCKFYNNQEGNHYCNLLEEKLETSDIRIDCAEHMER